MCKSIANYFSSKRYELHLFRIFGLSAKDYATFKIASTAKRRNAGVWFFNNLYFPLMVIISPIVLTIVHNFFNTVEYNKSLIEILISGSLTLLGINVLRTASTAITEKIDDSIVPPQLTDKINDVFVEIDTIRSKLERRIWIITFFGWGLYLLQIGQFVNAKHSFIYVILISVALLTTASILHGRFIYLMKTNFLDTEEAITLLFTKLLNSKNEFNKLENLLKSQGL